MQIFKRLFHKAATFEQVVATPKGLSFAPNNGEVLYVVGDIHGCRDLLVRMVEKIIDDIRATGAMQATVVFVGDYIDRGPDSAGTLQELVRISQSDAFRPVFLMGNHEAMMRDFLQAPTENMRWLRYGGQETLASFGVPNPPPSAGEDGLIGASKALSEALPEPILAFLNALIPYHVSGNVICVHAAAHPDTPIGVQSEKVLYWGHDRFMEEGGPEGYWVLHGHTITEKPDERLDIARIGVDTGAYLSGILTAVRVDKNEHRLISVSL